MVEGPPFYLWISANPQSDILSCVNYANHTHACYAEPSLLSNASRTGFSTPLEYEDSFKNTERVTGLCHDWLHFVACYAMMNLDRGKIQSSSNRD